MNSLKRDEQTFVDGDLSRLLKRWAAESQRTALPEHRTLLQRAAALFGEKRSGLRAAWPFSFGLPSPEYLWASTPYLMMTFQTARLRLVI